MSGWHERIDEAEADGRITTEAAQAIRRVGPHQDSERINQDLNLKVNGNRIKTEDALGKAKAEGQNVTVIAQRLEAGGVPLGLALQAAEIWIDQGPEAVLRYLAQ